MAPPRSSQKNSGGSGREAIKAASKYIRNYPKHAIKYLVDECDPFELLKDACNHENDEYYTIMAQDSDCDDDTASRSSRRRTLSSNTRPGLTSSLSAITTSSDSGEGSAKSIWVTPETGSKTTVRAIRLPHSDYLIQAKVVHERFNWKANRLPSITNVHYNKGSLQSQWVIELEWSWSARNKAQRNSFYLVDELPDSEVVLPDSDYQDSPISHDGDVSFGRNVRPNLFDNSPVNEMPPTFQNHGSKLQQSPNSRSVTENSTATTAKQTYAAKSGQGRRERRESTASDSSKIPRRTSGNSIAQSSIGRSSISGRPPSIDSQILPPLGATGPTSGLNVVIISRGSQWFHMLELDAGGAIFYESLSQTIKKKTKQELNQDIDEVLFTTHMDSFEKGGCWVSLMEHRVVDEWPLAVNWIRQTMAESKCKIYAVVGPDHD